MNYIRVLSLICCSFISLQSAAGLNNIAPSAKITSSTELNGNFKAANVTDGMIGVDGQGEWACEGVTTDWGYIRFPWIRLEWEQPQLVNKILLFDRANLTDHIAGGKLVFSDGSEIWVSQIPNDGTARLVKFEAKKVSWIKFIATDGKGKDLGFSEIEVYPANSGTLEIWLGPQPNKSWGVGAIP